MKRFMAIACAAVVLPLSPLAGQGPGHEPRALGVEASIASPSTSNIRGWTLDDNRGIWVQDSSGAWYYGKFSGVCNTARYPNGNTTIDTFATSKLDRFSAVLVGGERCLLDSFVTSESPAKQKQKEAQAKAEQVTHSHQH